MNSVNAILIYFPAYNWLNQIWNDMTFIWHFNKMHNRVEKILSTKLFLGFWKIEYILRRMVYTYFRYDPLWPHNDLSEKFKKYNFWPKICNFLQNIKNLGGKWNNLKNYEYKAIILANLAAGLTFVAKIMFKLSKSIKNWQF